MLQKLAYEAKYTAGTYMDSALSIPIWLSEKASGFVGRIVGKEKTELDKAGEDLRRNSPLFRGREMLRDKLDTRPGTLYIQSNCVSIVPFILVGMPAAEAAASGIESIAKNAPEMAKHVGISLSTLGAQMATAYSAFVANETRVNTDKFRGEDGKISGEKVGRFAWDAIKTFWKFDLTYVGAKSALQTYYLYTDRDPWEASALADSVGIPGWYAIAISLGLRGGLIETKDSERIYGKREESREVLESVSSENE